jgi:hypothetical protein
VVYHHFFLGTDFIYHRDSTYFQYVNYLVMEGSDDVVEREEFGRAEYFLHFVLPTYGDVCIVAFKCFQPVAMPHQHLAHFQLVYQPTSLTTFTSVGNIISRAMVLECPAELPQEQGKKTFVAYANI